MLRSFQKHLSFMLIIAAPFMCPVCSAHGENAHDECEANIEDKPGTQTDPVCVLQVSTESSIFKYRRRFCDSGKWYHLTRDYCEKNNDCATAVCDTSGCIAELPTSGIMAILWLT